jgi:hypothetical protein
MGGDFRVLAFLSARFDYNCRIPYVNNSYISIAVKGTRYTVVMISK